MSGAAQVPAFPPERDREEAIALAGLVALFAITAAWWALAFWPVEDGPGWLARTRWVCFGVSADGLPDGGGWIGLIGGPIGMLIILLAGWGRGVRAVLERARHVPLLRATLALMMLGTLVVVGSAGLRVRQAMASPFDETGSLPPAESYPRLDRIAPPLELVAHDGRTLTLDSLRGRTALVTFAYAHCETVCPVVVRNTLAAQARLRERGVDAAVLVVTLDPWRDTPARLPAMAAGWALPGDAWVLGGAVEVVEAMLDAWQVPRSRDTTTGAIAHPSLVYIVAPDGTIAYAANGDPDAMTALVERI